MWAAHKAADTADCTIGRLRKQHFPHFSAAQWSKQIEEKTVEDWLRAEIIKEGQRSKDYAQHICQFAEEHSPETICKQYDKRDTPLKIPKNVAARF